MYEWERTCKREVGCMRGKGYIYVHVGRGEVGCMRGKVHIREGETWVQAQASRVCGLSPATSKHGFSSTFEF